MLNFGSCKSPHVGFERFNVVENHDQMVNMERPFVIVTGQQSETRLMMRALLQTWNFDAIDTADVRESVAAAEARTPDLIIVDATLPFEESLSRLRLLKGDLSHRNIPLVVISGFNKPEYRRAALSSGASEFLVKPLDFDQLQEKLNFLISRNH